MITTRIETTILKHLINDEDYARKVIPFLSSEYFSESTERLLLDKIVDFVNEYNTVPTRESLLIELDKDEKIADGEFQNATKIVQNLTIEEQVQKEWLLDQTALRLYHRQDRRPCRR